MTTKLKEILLAGNAKVILEEVEQEEKLCDEVEIVKSLHT